MAQFQGGCICGQITYAANAEPLFSGVCHCKDCQRGTGSAFSCVVAVPDAQFAVTGTPKHHTHTGGSGKGVTISFCPNCGSRLFSQVEAMQGVTMIEAGTLDDTSVFQPQMHIFRDSAQHWFPFAEGMVTFPKMPPMAG